MAARIGLVLCALLMLKPGLTRGEVDGADYRSEKWRVALSAPPNWQISESTSYPNILVWMSFEDGKMLLSAEPVATKTKTALDYAKTTATLLAKQGFKVRTPQYHPSTGSYLLTFDDGQSFLRQAFTVKGSTGYVLTLAAASSNSRNSHLLAFDQTLSSIRVISRDAPATGSPAKDESEAAP